MNDNAKRIFAAKRKIDIIYANPKINVELRQFHVLEAKFQNFHDQLSESYQTLKKNKPAFFDQNDYDWFQNKNLFSDAWERYLQLNIIRILSDVRSDYSVTNRFNDIAIVFVNSESYFAESRVCDEIKFIIISSSLKRLLGNYVWYMSELYQYGEGCGLKDDFTCCKILTQMQNDPFIKRKTFAFLGTILKSANYESSSAFTPDLSNLDLENSRDPNIFLLHSTMELVEMYIVNHELAHLIDGTFDAKRTLDLEISTDISAASLNIVYLANSKNSRIAFAIGPVLFFEFSILFVLMRSILYLNSANSNINVEGDLKELVARKELFVHHIKHHYILDEFVDLYKVVSVKLGIQFDIIKKLMLEQL